MAFDRNLPPDNRRPSVPGQFTSLHTSLDYINVYDGTQNTLLTSENIYDAYEGRKPSWDPIRDGERALPGLDPSEVEGLVGFMWMAAKNEDELAKMRMGSSIPDRPTGTFSPAPGNAASNHSGGVNATFCDGHAKFIVEDIDYLVYQHLMSPFSAKARKKLVDDRWSPENLAGVLDEGAF